MNTHNPHDIGIFIENICLSVIHLILRQLLDVAQEMKDTVKARLLESGRLRHKHFHISPALLTAGLCDHKLEIPGGIDQCFQQLMNRRINRHLPVMIKGIQEIRNLLF